uniref:Pre-B-cell leukemia transcription factor-interacting protein 1 n=1 Tax=Cyanoderma ruficeps TaxID=181631 RepID=A0A8C3QH02_9PASS
MAEKLDPRDSESSGVPAGSEGLPIDTVGPEQNSTSHSSDNEELEEEDEGTQDTVTAVTTNGATTLLSQTLYPEGSGQGDPEECEDSRAWAVPAPDGSAEPSTLEGNEQEEPNAGTEPKACPDTSQAGPTMEDVCCTSSENNVEGLRWRQGHKPHPESPTVTPAAHQGTPDTGDDGLTMSKYLLGALALVAVGLLIITGGIYDTADGPVESVGSWDLAAEEQESLLSIDSNDSQQKPPLPDAGGPQSMQSMSQLLDKLAKENQEIRLMQAELQAHKEDLRALLHKSEGKVAEAGAQQQSLAAENAQLRAALEREVTALREAQAELRRLQATGAPGSPREPTAEQPRATGAPVHSKAAARQHGSLDSLRQELAATLDRVQGSGDLKGLVEKLSTLDQHLAQVLEAEELGSISRPWKKPFKVEKDSKWHKHHGARGSPHEQERRDHGKPHKKDPRTPHEHRPGKAWGKLSHSHPQHGSQLLEEVAWQEWGDKEAVDGFEEYILQHYSGASRNVWSQRAPKQHGTRG